MMDDPKFPPGPSGEPGTESPAGMPGEEPVNQAGTPAAETPAAETPAAEAAGAPAPVSAAVEKFKSCRWRAAPEDGEFCTHRDVLPFAGKDGFVPESWCPDCAFYKLRRTPKKRERVDYTY